MPAAVSRARLLAALVDLTGGRTMRWVDVETLATRLGVTYRAAALAIGEAKVAGLVDMAGMPPHSVALTDAGRTSISTASGRSKK